MWDIVSVEPLVWRFVALPAGADAAYVWHWLCEDAQGAIHARSSRGYGYYYECLEDARRHGYGGGPGAPGPGQDCTGPDALHPPPA